MRASILTDLERKQAKAYVKQDGPKDRQCQSSNHQGSEISALDQGRCRASTASLRDLRAQQDKVKSLSLDSDRHRASLSPLMSTAGTSHRMNPLTQHNGCRHPELEIMAKFRGDETVYRCLVCEAVVSSRELGRGNGID
jgi:hypothetical protein